GQKEPFRIGDHHADDFVGLHEADAFDAAGVAAHGTGVGLGEANGHALPRAQDNFVTGLSQDHVDQRVALFEGDADDAAALGPAVVYERGFFHDAAARRHEQVLVFLEAAHGNYAGDLLLGFERQDVGNRPPGAGAAHLWNIVDLQ